MFDKMVNISEIKKSFWVSLWFMFLTFPIMVIRVNTIENIIEWRWINMLIVGVGSFLLSLLWRYSLKKKEYGLQREEEGGKARAMAGSIGMKLWEGKCAKAIEGLT